MLIIACFVLIAAALLVSGIYLIIKRKERRWHLPVGIICILLFLASLPVLIPILLVGMLALTGGSFGP